MHGHDFDFVGIMIHVSLAVTQHVISLTLINVTVTRFKIISNKSTILPLKYRHSQHQVHKFRI